MQLANDNAFSAVDNESTFRSHVRYCTEEDVLDNGIEILMVRVGAIKFEFSFERNAIR